MTYDYDVVIVGAGAAGVGLAHVLKTLEKPPMRKIPMAIIGAFTLCELTF